MRPEGGTAQQELPDMQAEVSRVTPTPPARPPRVPANLPYRPVRPLLRCLLAVFSVLTLLAVSTLYVLTEHTDRYFAWTIKPPVTAAFLGAGYGAGCVLVLTGLRSRAWVVARIPMVTIFVFTVLTLVATLLHLDRFHFSASGGLARFAAWFWFIVYLLVPAALGALIVRHELTPGSDPRKHLPLPVWLRAVLAVQGVLLLAVGIALFVSPGLEDVLWPWPLTPLTARVVAAWLVAFGVAELLAVAENDLPRLRLAAAAYAIFGVLQLVALLRYGGYLRWEHPSAWAYLAVLVTIPPAGAYGYLAARAPLGGPPFAGPESERSARSATGRG